MKRFNKHLLEKFFNGSCSSEQAEEVLDWLDTTEGQEYLNERLQNELEEWEDDSEEVEQKNRSAQPFDDNTLDSALLIKKIIQRLGWNNLVPERRFFVKPLVQIAATLMVIATATLFYIHTERNNTNVGITQSVIYSTTSEQQKQIRLRDGSVVRLNSHSELRVAGDFNIENRSMTLQGEAFFDVIHQPDKPFIVQAGASEIEVLGTSFNVKLTDNQANVGVAVTEGKVRLAHADREKYSQSVVLEKGHYGDLITENGQILIGEAGIENYLSWKSGRLVFDNMSMEEICVQLGRIYGFECVWNNLNLKYRKLTMDFQHSSVEKTLSILADVLGINFTLLEAEQKLYWYN